MSELTVTVVRLGLLIGLWVFVFSVVGVLRGDLYGTRVSSKPSKSPGRAERPPAPKPAPKPAAKPLSRAARRAPRSIAVTEGALTGTTITLAEQPVLLGRSPEATLVLEDDYASGRHARIYPQDGEWWVEDLGSTNGTFLGRDRLTTPTRLEAGATLRIGTTVLELRR